jgi:hypothetical protein
MQLGKVIWRKINKLREQILLEWGVRVTCPSAFLQKAQQARRGVVDDV